MSSYENKETIIDEVGNVVISLIDFPTSSRSPFEEVVLFIKESKIEESRQVVLHPDQARRIAMALIKAAYKVESEWKMHELMMLDSTLHLSVWEDEGGASGTQAISKK